MEYYEIFGNLIPTIEIVSSLYFSLTEQEEPTLSPNLLHPSLLTFNKGPGEGRGIGCKILRLLHFIRPKKNPAVQQARQN